MFTGVCLSTGGMPGPGGGGVWSQGVFGPGVVCYWHAFLLCQTFHIATYVRTSMGPGT